MAAAFVSAQTQHVKDMVDLRNTWNENEAKFDRLLAKDRLTGDNPDRFGFAWNRNYRNKANEVQSRYAVDVTCNNKAYNIVKGQPMFTAYNPNTFKPACVDEFTALTWAQMMASDNHPECSYYLHGGFGDIGGDNADHAQKCAVMKAYAEGGAKAHVGLLPPAAPTLFENIRDLPKNVNKEFDVIGDKIIHPDKIPNAIGDTANSIAHYWGDDPIGAGIDTLSFIGAPMLPPSVRKVTDNFVPGINAAKKCLGKEAQGGTECAVAAAADAATVATIGLGVLARPATAVASAATDAAAAGATKVAATAATDVEAMVAQAAGETEMAVVDAGSAGVDTVTTARDTIPIADAEVPPMQTEVPESIPETVTRPAPEPVTDPVANPVDTSMPEPGPADTVNPTEPVTDSLHAAMNDTMTQLQGAMSDFRNAVTDTTAQLRGTAATTVEDVEQVASRGSNVLRNGLKGLGNAVKGAPKAIVKGVAKNKLLTTYVVGSTGIMAAGCDGIDAITAHNLPDGFVENCHKLQHTADRVKKGVDTVIGEGIDVADKASEWLPGGKKFKYLLPVGIAAGVLIVGDTLGVPIQYRLPVAVVGGGGYYLMNA